MRESGVGRRESGDFAALSIEEFCAELASGRPTPGGGAAAALLAKLAAALVQMVANHTVGRPKYAAVEARMRDILGESGNLSRKAGDLMDADAAAFGQVSAAFKLAKDDPGRASAVSQACQAATDVPLAVMRAAASLAELAAEVFAAGNQTLSGDARSGLLLAQAAAECSLGNVLANRAFILDQAWAEAACAEAGQLRAHIAGLRRQIEQTL